MPKGREVTQEPTDSSFGLGDAQERLWRLIDHRSRAGADTATIDRHIWDLFGEDWAVMFTDLSGFSRQVETFGIIHFLQIIQEKKRLLRPIVEAHDGFLVKTEADSFLLLFRRADAALACAIAMQHAARRHSERRRPDEQLLLCVGLGFGRILRVGEREVFGAEVNAASRLGEDTARSGEILVTCGLRGALTDTAGLTFAPLAQRISGSPENFQVGYPGP